MMLRKAREGLGLSLRDAARKLGVSPTYLSRVETGKEAPSRGLLARASTLYEVDSDTLHLEAGRIPPDVEQALLEVPGLCRWVRSKARQYRGRR